MLERVTNNEVGAFSATVGILLDREVSIEDIKKIIDVVAECRK